MNRENVIQELETQLNDLTRLHIQHRLEHTENFRRHKDRISNLVFENEIDVRRELSPVSWYQYRRYFL